MAGQRIASRAVVVGAGWAGLTAAIRLQQRGVQVTVLEQAPRPGGRAFSFQDTESGVWLDNGQHVLLGLCEAAVALLGESGQETAIRFQRLLSVPVVSSAGRHWLGSQRWPGPLHLVPAVLRYRALSGRERLGVLKAGLAIAGGSPQNSLAEDTKTWGEWLAEHGQTRRSRQYFWDAIGREVMNAPSDEAGAALGLATFSLLLQRGFSGARLGFFIRPLSQVSEQLADYARALGVQILLSHGVSRIRVENGRVVGVLGPKGTWLVDQVVLAVPPDRLAALVSQSGLDGQLAVPAMTFSPIVNAYLFYDRPVWPEEVALLLDEEPAAMVFNRREILGQGHGAVLAVSISAADALRRHLSADLGGAIARRVAARLGIPLPTRTRIVWQPHATFRSRPGIEAHRPEPRTAINGVYLAGDWTRTGWPATLESAVLSGQAAAQEMLAL
ncbi:hydroxysqualene dehydroxylase HpnE [Sulfobacillus harzensis]|uniref:FAD-dependent oxidoreductase n=1 Tax=Sulfobacillus harzensis TaxID=2729629 RepID=A0A7Y0L112_9FIRM|nr:hydroxysqualene dehydroxylase HpnE [Sulfobacillus harzensis]NMP21073.1 FAD-dependent oxidoreductase [Sulfobacillus harzensis]